MRERVPSAARRVRAFLVSLVVLLATALPARADDFAALVTALGGDSFSEKEQAVIALGKLGDARAVPVLTALRDGHLDKTPDGRVIVAEAANAAAGQRVRVNNRLRSAIEAALGALTLFSR